MSTHDQADNWLLGALLQTKAPAEASPIPPAPTPAVITQPAPPRIVSRERIKRSRNTTIDKWGRTGALLASVVLSALLWLAGAYFTVQALASFGVNTASLLWWLVPISITLIEWWLMPRSGDRIQSYIVFGMILAVDMATSWYGLIEVFAGRFVPFGAGFTIPAGGELLHGTAIFVAAVFAFAPEKFGRWAIEELQTLWGQR